MRNESLSKNMAYAGKIRRFATSNSPGGTCWGRQKESDTIAHLHNSAHLKKQNEKSTVGPISDERPRAHG